MKILRNNYHKTLNFEVNGRPIGIPGNGTLSVEDKDAEVLLKNPWIESFEKKTLKIEKSKVKYKGRKKK